ncbi:MAG TPA: hypothetical protein VK186_16345, partial [Candidatus Deferrimicrobium sp.]|nr:hypothetical protein [Candidatus Deferrimicrobium sp.]
MKGNNRFFPIIMWLEAHPAYMNYDLHTAEEFYELSFKGIASLKCNTVRPSNLPLDYAHLLLRSAARYNLKVILDPQFGHAIIKKEITEIKNQWESLKADIKRNVIDQFAGYENLLGYAVADEPKPDKLEHWKLVVKMFNELDPRHPDFTVFNLPDILKAAVDYEDVILRNIVYDNYPHEIFTPINTMGPPFKPEPDLELEWFNRYKGFYEASNLRPSVPQISTVAVFNNNKPWRFPTPTEFRTTVYTSLAVGAKGIMFFAYMDVPGEENLKCLVDRNWHPHSYPTTGPFTYPYAYPPLYETVKTVTEELDRLGPYVSELERVGDVTGWEMSNDVLGGKYKSQHAEYFIIAHKDPDPTHARIDWNVPLANEYSLRDIISGETFRPDGSGNVTVPLGPAQGRVLIKRFSQDAPLFGSFDLPSDNARNIAGAISLTGWALGISPVKRIEIKRLPVAGDPPEGIDRDGLIYVGDAS